MKVEASVVFSVRMPQYAKTTKMKRPPAVDVALELEMNLGEGAFWDGARQAVVWVDILNGEIHELAGSDHRVHRTDTHVGVAAPRRRGGWVLAVREGFGAFDPDTGHFEILKRVGVPGTRMNDGNVDRRGRFFAGSMLYSEQAGGGRLYRLDPDLSVGVVLDQVSVSNGIDWSPDGRAVYYVDSNERTITRFDFDEDTAAWSNAATFARLAEGEGFPDGLTVDSDGCVWLAVWDGAQVRRYSPDGRVDQVFKMPAPRVTSCGFGGPDLATLFITTARVGLTASQLQEYPLSGSLFAIRPGVSGSSRNSFAG
jgi:sugar lactone lactonase YvrE